MSRSPAGLGSALEAVPALISQPRPIALFLDYDGTLTEIVARPEDAVLSNEMREAVHAAAAAFALVAVVSGRDRRQLEELVGLPQLAYVGSHGFDIVGPRGSSIEHEVGNAHLPALDAAESALRARLAGVPGARVERKRFSIAVHFRQAPRDAHALVEQTVDEVRSEHADLRKGLGKAVFELQPNLGWNKGKAVLWLLEQRRLGGALPIHVGDDLTDESAFAALAGRGVGIFVGDCAAPTAATLRLRDLGEVLTFLGRLVAAVRQRQQQQQ